MAIFQGREILVVYARKFSQQSFFYEACKPVPNSECLKAREFLRKKVYPEGAQDILRRLQTLMASASEPVCGRCRGTMENYIDVERKEIWYALPEIFNLPKGAHAANFKGRLIIADYPLKIVGRMRNNKLTEIEKTSNVTFVRYNLIAEYATNHRLDLFVNVRRLI